MTAEKEALAVAAVEKIVKGGRHAATLISSDEIMAMAELVLAMAQRIGPQQPDRA